MSNEKHRTQRTQGKYCPASEYGPNHRKKKERSMEPHKHDGCEPRYNGNAKSSAHDDRKQESRRNSRKLTHAETFPEKFVQPVEKRESNVSEKNIVLKYEEDSKVVFSELEDKPHIKVITNVGWHSLSNTDEGESKIFYEPDFIEHKKADHYFNTIHEKVDWFDKNIVINGEEYPQPRLVAWYGPLPYTYSGVTLQPREFPSLIAVIKESVENILKRADINVNLNSVLLNLYRNGKDSVAWHSDDESSMGIQPTIASVSLGETRRFEMRRKPRVMRSDDPAQCVVYLQHGSLVVMDGVMQTDWQHRVPKEYHSKEPRINLTFRTVYPIEKVPRKCLSQFKEITPFIPAPYPRIKAEPFQLQDELFPALGEIPDHLRSEPHNPIGNQRTKESNEKSLTNKSVVTERNYDINYENETEPVHLNPNSPMIQPSTTKVDNQGVWDESDDAPNQNVAADITMDADSNISETWKDTDISKVCEFIPKDKHASKKESMHRHASEKRERVHPRKEHHHRTNSGSANYSSEKTPKSNRKANPPETDEYNEEEFEIRRLNDVYDYISDKGQKIPFKWYHWDEIKVLMSVVEHSGSLPTHILHMLSDRLEYLIVDAESRNNYEKSQKSYYGSDKNKRNNKRY